MNALWNFEGGKLVARNQAGVVLWTWFAEEEMGRPLADLLNQSPSLGRLLLPPAWQERCVAAGLVTRGARQTPS